jgi:uncharacterized membrane protein YccF (DUF307 family)
MSTSPASKPVYAQVPARGPGCLVQMLWFVLVGWWLGGLAISLAWLLNVTIIGLPLGMAILNNIPKLLALQEPRTSVAAVARGDGTVMVETDLPQHGWLLRTAFFLLIGWWWSGVWLAMAYAVAATVILLPLALEMFRWTPAMTTLRRY